MRLSYLTSLESGYTAVRERRSNKPIMKVKYDNPMNSSIYIPIFLVSRFHE